MLRFQKTMSGKTTKLFSKTPRYVYKILFRNRALWQKKAISYTKQTKNNNQIKILIMDVQV